MFLFDRSRSSRQDYASGNGILSINWKTFLNTNPSFGAESTAVFDEEQNIYFGSHSGNFYSLDKHGKIRWVFTTKKKIYSSPVLINNLVIFVGGDGYVYSLNKEGKFIWKYDLAENYKKNGKFKKLISFLIHLPFTYSFSRKKNIIYGSWSSPNFLGNKIFVTGFDSGLVCLDLDGYKLWSQDLGFPKYQLSGVAIDDHERIYCSSRRGYAYCLDMDGRILWKKRIKLFGEPWGNPVVDNANEQVIVFFSRKEKQGTITVLGFDAELRWEKNFGAIRGSCAITRDGNYMYVCDLDGYLYKINSASGEIIQKKKISNAIRSLWTTPTIEAENNILISTKDSEHSGRVMKLNSNLDIIWQFKTSKTLSIPVVNKKGDIFFGGWDGYYYSIKTK